MESLQTNPLGTFAGGKLLSKALLWEHKQRKEEKKKTKHMELLRNDVGLKSEGLMKITSKNKGLRSGRQ